MTAADASTASAPATIAGVIASDSSSQPTTTATSGLTYAYVETVEIGTFASSHTNAA